MGISPTAPPRETATPPAATETAATATAATETAETTAATVEARRIAAICGISTTTTAAARSKPEEKNCSTGKKLINFIKQQIR